VSETQTETDGKQDVWIVPNTSKPTDEQRFHTDRDCRQLGGTTHAIRCVSRSEAEERGRNLCQTCWDDGHPGSGRGVECPHCEETYASLGRHIPCPEGPEPPERGGVRR